jgi:folate-dependent phosphoribosylglycinamide formyltransferase PurN
MVRPWIALFSQTGSEIANIAAATGIWPDLIIVNERNIHRVIDSRLHGKPVVFVPNTPTCAELLELISMYRNPLITLHGWLRIIPPQICTTYDIYNGHPGLITEYPELKGKDPQIRAIQGDYDVAGCVLHKVTAGVDEGEVLLSEKFSIKRLVESEIFHIFSNTSLTLWVEFLRTRL